MSSDLEDRVKRLEDEMWTKDDMRELYEARENEPLSVAAKRFFLELDQAKENERMADGVRRVCWLLFGVSVTAIFGYLWAIATGKQ